MTDRLVVTVEGMGTDALSPATEWYPRRSQLVRDLEAAKQLAKGREWASLLISDEPLFDATHEQLAGVVAAGTPHLTASERTELCARYLGNLTCRQARLAVDLPITR
jgi:hypothetical protein